MLKFVLTGSIGTGKTTVSNLMKQEGAIIIDTDLIVHSIYTYPSKTSLKIIETFGPECLDQEKNIINRKKLGEKVIHNEKSLKELNNIVHPAVYEEVNNITEKYLKLENESKKNYLLIYVIPLFFETNSKYEYDYIVVSACKPETQLERLIKRENYTKEEAEKRISLQIPINEKIKKADFVIDTNGTFEDIKENVILLLNKFKWDKKFNND